MKLTILKKTMCIVALCNSMLLTASDDTFFKRSWQRLTSYLPKKEPYIAKLKESARNMKKKISKPITTFIKRKKNNLGFTGNDEFAIRAMVLRIRDDIKKIPSYEKYLEMITEEENQNENNKEGAIENQPFYYDILFLTKEFLSLLKNVVEKNSISKKDKIYNYLKNHMMISDEENKETISLVSIKTIFFAPDDQYQMPIDEGFFDKISNKELLINILTEFHRIYRAIILADQEETTIEWAKRYFKKQSNMVKDRIIYRDWKPLFEIMSDTEQVQGNKEPSMQQKILNKNFFVALFGNTYHQLHKKIIQFITNKNNINENKKEVV